MSSRVGKHELVHLRNDLPIKEVLHVLGIQWKQDDQLCRFVCPCCQGMHSSIHPTENIGYCFYCRRKFNPIDLVQEQRKIAFRTAVAWLKTFESARKGDDYSRYLAIKRNHGRVK
jgi:hypothetical protein